MPKKAPPVSGSSMASTVSPSSRTATAPIARTPSSQSPVETGENVPLMRAPNRVASMPAAGSLSQYHASREAGTVAVGPVGVRELDDEVAAHRRQVLGDRAAGLVADVDAPLAQRVERSEAVVGRDPGAAAALLAPEPCVRADEGERRRALEREERALVLEQHAAAGGGAADHGPGVGIVGRRLRGRRAGRLRPLDQREDALDGGIELGLLDLAGGERRPQLVAAVQRRPGHLDVEPGPQRLDRAVVAEPVAHDDAVEAPVAPQHLGQQPLVVGAVGPVEPVVRAHHGAHVRPRGRPPRRARSRARAACARRPRTRSSCARTRSRWRRSA